jgi:cytochrome c oxidase assembly protein subunit 15
MLAHRLALSTAAATVVLIVFGGLVTNTGAALAVPDWPTTFGHNMFLYPWSGMVGGVFYEHSHRLLGAMVGLLTVALAAALWPRGGRLRMLGLIALASVVAQGVIGGLRVVLLTDGLAMVHGPLAQAFLALIAALAFLTSGAAARPRAAAAPALRRLSLLAVAVVYAQIMLGALLTHAGRLWLHVAGAVAVFAVTPLVTARARRADDPVAAPLARVLLVLLAAQLALGLGAYLARFSGIWIPGGQLTMLVLPVTHRLVGGLLLAGTVVLAVRLCVAAGENGPSATFSWRGSRRPPPEPPHRWRGQSPRSERHVHLDRARRPMSTVVRPEAAAAGDAGGASHLDGSRRPVSTVAADEAGTRSEVRS